MSVTLDEAYEDEYYILTPEGDLYYPDEYEFKDENFEALVNHEVFKKEVSRKRSPHIAFMRKLKIAERDPCSDSGHLIYLPRGTLMLDILSDVSLNTALSLGAIPVKSSILYDLSIPAIEEHAKLFGQRMYMVKPEKRVFVLRYAACFGQFSLLSRHYLSYKDFPLKLIEIADSYRYEQRGEVSGLARLRRFYMPDMHVLLKDIDEAMDEFKKIYKLIFAEGARFGWTYYSLYNVDLDFLKEKWTFITDLVRLEGKPVLLHTIKPGKYYWKINIEFNYIDSQKRPLETATIQIDVGNARRFGIKYIDKDGDKRYPVIIHTAIYGSLERFLYEFLEEAAKMSLKGKKPSLPVWLSPIQVRFIPVSDKYLSKTIDLANYLNKLGFRVDIDDRTLTVSKKVLEAEKEWIPFMAIIGEKEVSTGQLSVRVREENKIIKLTIEELATRLTEETGHFPKRPSYIPLMVSKRSELV